MKRQAKKPVPKYVCCVATYYEPSDEKKRLVRTTAAIVEINTKKMVEWKEFYADKSLEEIGKATLKMAKPYKAILHCIKEPQELMEYEPGKYRITIAHPSYKLN